MSYRDLIHFGQKRAWEAIDEVAPSSRQKYTHGEKIHTFSLCPGPSQTTTGCNRGAVTPQGFHTQPLPQGLLGKHAQQLPLGRWQALVTPHAAADVFRQKHSHEKGGTAMTGH